ncbi:hypothetical protein [Pseudomonas koreensis]|uniref:hypothetical protein n=1 Tax=Pseudomonas koreensis TaxID=198620 RepID=UPI0039E19CFE
MSYLIDAPEFVSFGGDSAIRVIDERASSAAGQGDLGQAISGVPLILSNRAKFVLPDDLSGQDILAVSALTIVRQTLFLQLTKVVPARWLQERRV